MVLFTIWYWNAVCHANWRGGRSLDFSGIQRLLRHISSLSDTAMIQSMGHFLGHSFRIQGAGLSTAERLRIAEQVIKSLSLEPKHCKARSTSRATLPL